MLRTLRRISLQAIVIGSVSFCGFGGVSSFILSHDLQTFVEYYRLKYVFDSY